MCDSVCGFDLCKMKMNYDTKTGGMAGCIRIIHTIIKALLIIYYVMSFLHCINLYYIAG